MYKIIEAEYTADGVGLPFVYLRPDLGKNYRVITAFGFHDDNDARTCNWIYKYQGIGTMHLAGVSLAQNVRLAFMVQDATSIPVIQGQAILRHNAYAGFYAPLLDTNNKVKIRAFVEEFEGPDD